MLLQTLQPAARDDGAIGGGVRPRKLSDEEIARIRWRFTEALAARDRCRREIAGLPSVEQLALECACSTAMVRRIGAGHRYASEQVLSTGMRQDER